MKVGPYAGLFVILLREIQIFGGQSDFLFYLLLVGKHKGEKPRFLAMGSLGVQKYFPHY